MSHTTSNSIPPTPVSSNISAGQASISAGQASRSQPSHQPHKQQPLPSSKIALQTAKSTDVAIETNARTENKTSILVVDDEPTTRLLLCAAMKKEGYRVFEAGDGYECIEIFRTQQPDIVLLDAIMPKMDGFECCLELKRIAKQKHSPILMITSLDDPDSVNQAFESGAVDYATKPIHWALLRQRVRCLQESVKRRESEQQVEASLREKEALLKEIHHRVKNNLQIISSLLNLQSKSIDDKNIIDLFRESQNRVRLMALIHEKLYQSSDLSRINFKEYVEVLLSYLLRSYEVSSQNIQLTVNIEDFSLEIDTAVSCGLIINELISNSLKYAFPKQNALLEDRTQTKTPSIVVSASLTDSQCFDIEYKDNGIGLPHNLDIEEAETLGLQIISSLTDQLDGQLQIKNQAGATFLFKGLSLSR